MDPGAHRSLVKAAAEILEADANPISQIVLLAEDGLKAQALQEGKWINGRFERNIRIDLPTHFQGLQGQKSTPLYTVEILGTN
jgi:hypothetical protein